MIEEKLQSIKTTQLKEVKFNLSAVYDCLRQFDNLFAEAKSFCEFKIIARFILSAATTSKSIFYSAIYIRGIANGHQIKEAFAFACRLFECQLWEFQPLMKERLLKRIFRRANPLFKLPDTYRPCPHQEKDIVFKNRKKDRWHTVDPGRRAASIADKEANIDWRKTGNFDTYLNTWNQTFASALREFCSD